MFTRPDFTAVEPLNLALAQTTTLPFAGTHAAGQEPAGKRAKLWELGDKHHCPIIGTCVPFEDLVRLAKRFGFAAHPKNEFALHVEAVNYAHSKNEVSVTLQRLLDKKYTTHLERYARIKTSTDLLQTWKESLNSGQVAGPLWAVYTHKRCTSEIRQIVFADIHMLSHQVGAGLAVDARRLETLEKENRELKRALQQQRQDHEAQVASLLREKSTLLVKFGHALSQEQQLEDTRKRLQAFESGQIVIELGQKLTALQASHDHLLEAAQRAWDLEKNLKAAHSEMARFAEEREAALDHAQMLEQMLEQLTQAEASCNGPSEENCQGCTQSLSSRCVLFVGGRASMIAQYRQLADKLGIELIHHDGGLEESITRLPDLIHGADAVVCPTDNISHSAYYQVKSHCKRVGKPCLFYKGSGISSFASAIHRVQRGEFTLAQAGETHA